MTRIVNEFHFDTVGRGKASLDEKMRSNVAKSRKAKANGTISPQDAVAGPTGAKRGGKGKGERA